MKPSGCRQRARSGAQVEAKKASFPGRNPGCGVARAFAPGVACSSPATESHSTSGAHGALERPDLRDRIRPPDTDAAMTKGRITA